MWLSHCASPYSCHHAKTAMSAYGTCPQNALASPGRKYLTDEGHQSSARYHATSHSATREQSGAPHSQTHWCGCVPILANIPNTACAKNAATPTAIPFQNRFGCQTVARMSVVAYAEPIRECVGRIPHCNGYLFQGHEEGESGLESRTGVRPRDE